MLTSSSTEDEVDDDGEQNADETQADGYQRIQHQPLAVLCMYV